MVEVLEFYLNYSSMIVLSVFYSRFQRTEALWGRKKSFFFFFGPMRVDENRRA